MGRDLDHRTAYEFQSVSIRAPAWDATCNCRKANSQLKVSIRAPAWDATVICDGIAATISGFYPRARMGRDKNQQIGGRSVLLFLSARPHGTRPFKSKLLKNIRKVFTFR